MSRSYFQFKQFTIHQDQCGMKVSADACLLGAMAGFTPEIKSILDIGSGTGLLSLMMAQRYPQAQITALELDAAAVQQSKENVAQSPWPERIEVHHADLREWQQGTYEGIICNPPFFEDHLRSAEVARRQARHGETLSRKQLAVALHQLLRDDGKAVVLFPADQQIAFAQAAADAGLYCHERIQLRPNGHKPVNRIISCWQKTKPVLITETNLQLYHGQNQLTAEAAEVLRDFYIFL